MSTVHRYAQNEARAYLRQNTPPTWEEYQVAAIETWAIPHAPLTWQYIHGALGLAAEAAELTVLLEAIITNDATMGDHANFIYELGDVFYYATVLNFLSPPGQETDINALQPQSSMVTAVTKLSTAAGFACGMVDKMMFKSSALDLSILADVLQSIVDICAALGVDPMVVAGLNLEKLSDGHGWVESERPYIPGRDL